MLSEVGDYFLSTFITGGNMHEVIRGFLSVKKRQEEEGGFEDYLFCYLFFFPRKSLGFFFFFLTSVISLTF